VLPDSPKFKRAAYDAALSSSAPVIRDEPPVWDATLRPNRSLTRAGLRKTMLIAAIGFALPVLPFIYAGAGWISLPLTLTTFALLLLAFRQNNRAGQLCEYVRLWPDLIAVERHELNGDIKRWHCNPYWMRSKIVAEGGPVENYLTLAGSDREIELGAFLSPDERVVLQADIEREIKDLGQHYAM